MTQPPRQLQVGHKAPAFRAIAVGGEHHGNEITLATHAGRTLVLYFYPEDDTPGCTRQACGLRDAWPRLARKAAIYGVSIDPIKRHEKFIAKHALPFPLLSDESHALVEAYGVWVEKSLYGKKYFGTERTTFVIAPDGEIKAILRKVKPDAHAAQLLAALES